MRRCCHFYYNRERKGACILQQKNNNTDITQSNLSNSKCSSYLNSTVKTETTRVSAFQRNRIQGSSTRIMSAVNTLQPWSKPKPDRWTDDVGTGTDARDWLTLENKTFAVLYLRDCTISKSSRVAWERSWGRGVGLCPQGQKHQLYCLPADGKTITRKKVARRKEDASRQNYDFGVRRWLRRSEDPPARDFL